MTGPANCRLEKLLPTFPHQSQLSAMPDRLSTASARLLLDGGMWPEIGALGGPEVGATAARVVSELENSKENGLGKPLPKGVVRLYAPEPTGRQTFATRTTTPSRTASRDSCLDDPQPCPRHVAHPQISMADRVDYLLPGHEWGQRYRVARGT